MGTRKRQPGRNFCHPARHSAGRMPPRARYANNVLMYDAVVFAGGGNRCYWQGGFWEALTAHIPVRPRLVVGASAGAFAASYALLGLGPSVRAQVIPACGPQLRTFDFAAWRRGEPLCPVGPMYRDLIETILDADAFARLREMTDLRIAVTRLPRGLSTSLGAVIGIAAYQIEKHVLHPVHPRIGRTLGYRQDFVSIRDLKEPQQFHDALIASACVPPFMPVTAIGGEAAFDGGLVDNVPVSPIEEIERAGGQTLVLLTRVYADLPKVPGRRYVQPSQKIGVKQFDITNPDGIRAAYELGRRDGEAFLHSFARMA
jgi:predicted patatin/cPLA2 family phospholipase